MKLNRERVFSLCVIAFALAGILLTSNINKAFSLDSADPGPKLFPYICSIALLVCGIGKFITSKAGKASKGLSCHEWKKAGMIIGFSVLYAVLMYLFGYIPSTLIAGAGYVWLMRGKNKIRPVVLVIFTIVITAVIYLVFSLLLGIRMPTGILF
ncbi:MAG: tripartite tricarboxylate transporter TctB family protein [Clostridia bacterium]|nr:tripartite tricarboxylate transporter TctB family protein [Clostridia bacterium]